MAEVNLEITVKDYDFRGVVDEAISYSTGATVEQAANSKYPVYETRKRTDSGALTSFYLDVMFGRPMPSKFVVNSVTPDVMVAATIFFHRDLVTHPNLARLVHAIDFATRFGLAGMSHMDLETLNLWLVMTEVMFQGEIKYEDRLRMGMGWVHDFIHQGNLTPQARPLPEPQVLEVGTNGFVVAELGGKLGWVRAREEENIEYGWIRLIQRGFLRGVLYGPEVEGKRLVTAVRKSLYVPFDLSKAEAALNELEATRTFTKWLALGKCSLLSPVMGSTIPIEDVLKVFLRVV